MIEFFLVMIAMICVDVCWTFYFIKVEERKSMLAGVWSSLIMLIGAFVTINYIGDKKLLLAAIIGAFIGTAGSVEYKKRKEKENK